MSNLSQWFKTKSVSAQMESKALEGEDEERAVHEREIQQAKEQVDGQLENLELSSFQVLNKFYRTLGGLSEKERSLRRRRADGRGERRRFSNRGKEQEEARKTMMTGRERGGVSIW